MRTCHERKLPQTLVILYGPCFPFSFSPSLSFSLKNGELQLGPGLKD